MTKEFLKLVAENQNLPIIPMVYYEVVGDGCGRWLGEFGRAYVGEYALYDDRYYDDRDEFKERYYDINAEALEEKFEYNPRINDFTVSQNKYTRLDLEINTFNEKRLEEYLDKVADEYFTKAIIVNIDLPYIKTIY